jgi:hypothetical protein
VTATLVGLVLSVAAARATRLEDMTDLGLASVLPVTFWVGTALVVIAFSVAVARSPAAEPLLALPTAVLATVTFGVQALATTVPRDHVAFRHVGVVDQLVTSGAPDAGIDVYFNWPAFFALGAFVRESTGVDLLDVARWTPLLAHLALLLPLLLLMRSLLPDRRAAWVAVWVATLWDWVDQDYFSPQTDDYGLHLVVLALVAGWLLTERRGLPAEPRPQRERVSAYVVVLGLGLVLVPTHQLTPVTTALCLVALVLLHRLRQWGLPLVLLVAVGVWLLTGARTYSAGHDLLSVPDLTMLFDANVGSRVGGGSGLHQLVVAERMLMSAALWALAAVGAWRSHRAGRSPLVHVALALTPFVLLPLQAYGGEMLLRVHLFALPGMAALAAWQLAPPSAGRLRAGLAVALVSLLAVPGLVVARYGTDRLEIFTRGEVAAVQALYDAVPPGGLLVAAAPQVPWRDHDYATYRYTTLVDLGSQTTSAEDVRTLLLDRLEATGSGGVVVVRTAYEAAESTGSLAPDELANAERWLASDPRFELVHGSSDGRVYVYVGEE